jgi:hypothetical protein
MSTTKKTIISALVTMMLSCTMTGAFTILTIVLFFMDAGFLWVGVFAIITILFANNSDKSYVKVRKYIEQNN